MDLDGLTYYYDIDRSKISRNFNSSRLSFYYTMVSLVLFTLFIYLFRLPTATAGRYSPTGTTRQYFRTGTTPQYYIDPSCLTAEWTGIEAAVEEVIIMAQRIWSRMQGLKDYKDHGSARGKKDIDMPIILQQLFKIDGPDHSNFTDVLDTMRRLGEMTRLKETPMRGQLATRIFCDNDRRWKKLPDEPRTWRRPIPKKSWKDTTEQFTFMTEDGILNSHFTENEPPVCRSSNLLWRRPLAATYIDDAKMFSAMTICDLCQDMEPKTMYDLTENYPIDFPLSHWKSPDPDSVLSLVIFYQWMHTIVSIKGPPEDFAPVYSWHVCTKLKTEFALWNVQSYAYLAMLVMLGDWGIRLRPYNPFLTKYRKGDGHLITSLDHYYQGAPWPPPPPAYEEGRSL
ncbi:hypothetical protein EJ05DRAFT_515988 [Pseudovirgaria hyperparasitica]|uniref:Uncharacterized protein n=1 Tax=Pseudovirgaria hyperparasitica TaxID=470096 RepID=A0A6A6WK87_9PEZI|nr:uncharacterized protein EJ05DRAFT_515988 [Pseudovirgaria hyperparasitica]KAF2762576.1 hypothetical protein EJ05DRAFT_515988 [Pseudovirgaria hyperparasitica]